MGDERRQPEDSDRQPVSARVIRAHDQGRIGSADRDIRLAKVKSARSMTELDQMSRELDELDEASVPEPEPEPVPARARGVIVSVVVAIALIAAAVVFISHRASQSDGGVAVTTSGSATPTSDAARSPGARHRKPGARVPARPAYTLSINGIRAFLQTYRQRFGTSRVVDLTMYDEDVIVDVPVQDKSRQAGWLYRRGSWSSFGGVRATFPGAQAVNTKQLDVPALVRNIRRARATLSVRTPAQTYVILRSIRNVDVVPSVDIHLVNAFRESGYLATTLDGRVEKAFPNTR